MSNLLGDKHLLFIMAEEQKEMQVELAKEEVKKTAPAVGRRLPHPFSGVPRRKGGLRRGGTPDKSPCPLPFSAAVGT